MICMQVALIIYRLIFWHCSVFVYSMQTTAKLHACVSAMHAMLIDQCGTHIINAIIIVNENSNLNYSSEYVGCQVCTVIIIKKWYQSSKFAINPMTLLMILD